MLLICNKCNTVPFLIIEEDPYVHFKVNCLCCIIDINTTQLYTSYIRTKKEIMNSNQCENHKSKKGKLNAITSGSKLILRFN